MVQQMGCQYAIVRLTGKVSRSYHIDPWLNLSAEKNCQNLSIILFNVYAFLLSKSYQGFSTVIGWAGQVWNKYSHLKIKSKNEILRANQGFKKQPLNSLITMYFYIAVLSFFSSVQTTNLTNQQDIWFLIGSYKCSDPKHY